MLAITPNNVSRAPSASSVNDSQDRHDKCALKTSKWYKTEFTRRLLDKNPRNALSHTSELSKALNLTQSRLTSTQNFNTKTRLERRMQNINALSAAFSKNPNLKLVGVLGWGFNSDTVLTVPTAAGISEIDSIFYEDGSGGVHCVQLDSNIESQSLGILNYAKVNQPTNNDISNNGRTYNLSNFSNLNPSLDTEDYYGNNNFTYFSENYNNIQGLLSKINVKQSVDHLAVPVSHMSPALDTFISQLEQEIGGIASTKLREDFYEKVLNEFKPKDNLAHYLKVASIFQDPCSVRANGTRWFMPGNGRPATIGESVDKNGFNFIDLLVDLTTKDGNNDFFGNTHHPMPNSKSSDPEQTTNFPKYGVIPFHQVSGCNDYIIKLIQALINAKSNYSLLKMPDCCHIPKDLSDKLLEKLNEVLAGRLDHGSEINEFGYKWIYDTVNQYNIDNPESIPLDYRDITKRLLKQIKLFNQFSDHTGMCCPSCKGPEGHSEQAFIPPPTKPSVTIITSQEKPVLEHINFESDTTFIQSSICQLQNVFKTLCKKVDGLSIDSINKNLIDYHNQLKRYPVTSAYKQSMVIKYVVSICDFIKIYGLSVHLCDELNILKNLLLNLTTNIAMKSAKQPDPNDKKARFAIFSTLLDAISIFGKDKINANLKSDLDELQKRQL